ncbi:MAG: outer membrane beta-barrel protein [Nitrospinota bacterium]
MGALEFHPGFDVSYTHDNNIFLTRDQEKSDEIIRYIPSLRLDLPFGAASKASGSFKYERKDFDKFDTEDADNTYTTAALILERLFGSYYWKTNGNWDKTDDPSSSETQSTTGARTPHAVGKVSTSLGYGGYEENKVHLEINGSAGRDQYERALNDRLNKWDYRLGGIGEYKFTEKTAVRLDYGFIRTDFTQRASGDQRDDSRAHFVRGGLAFTPGALITGHATFGAEFREFDTSISADNRTDRDTTGFSADVDLTYAVQPERTTINLRFTAGLEPSSTPGQFGYQKYRADGTLTQGLFFLSDQLEASLTPSYEVNNFIKKGDVGANRKDKIVSVKVGLTYRAKSEVFPWFTSVEYEYKKKDSSEDTNDYRDNTVMVKVGLQF